MSIESLFDEEPQKAEEPAQIPEISYNDYEVIKREYENRELYALAKNKKTQMWKAVILPALTSEGWAVIEATFGFTDGAKQTKETYVKSGKNIGKKNETTLIEQSYIKLEQMYQDRIKKNSMVWDISEWVTPLRPQLASPYHKRKKHLSHVKAWLIDRKLDGNRAYTYADSSVQSKSGEPITPIKHLYEEHQKTFALGHHKYGEIHIDGEYYIHGVPLEDITSIIRKEKDEERSTDLLLEYHVYDCFFPEHPNLNALQRYEALQELFADNVNIHYHKLSEKEIVKNDENEIRKIAKKFVAEGYEGAMLRDVDGVYMHSKNISDRNDVLLKYKFMEDDEFFIVDIIENEQELGLPKFIIDLRNGNTCEVVMSGKKDNAKKYWLERDKYIKKAWIKVQYQSWTKYNKLSFPVGLEIREGSVDKDGKFDPKY